MSENPNQPSIFHIIHWKMGLRWVDVVLRNLYPDLIVRLKKQLAQVLAHPIIYPTVYLRHRQFIQLKDKKYFLILRDLRDTHVSRYFSWLKSYQLQAETGKFDLVEDGRMMYVLISRKSKHSLRH